MSGGLPKSKEILGQPIVVGVDDKQQAALSWAAIEAIRVGCDLTVVHSYRLPPGAPTVLNEAYGVDVEEGFREAGRAVLAEAVDYLMGRHPGLLIRCILTHGAAADVLASCSEKARMVVIGPDEQRPWYERLFQSHVARRLAGDSRCPLVVVPETWDVEVDSAGVTLMLDGTTTAHEPLLFAFEAADRGVRRLRIIHVLEPGEESSGADVWREMARLIELWGAMHPKVSVTTTMIGGPGTVTLVESVERTGLLVLGRPAESRAAAALSHTLAQKIIENADCPVVVVPRRP